MRAARTRLRGLPREACWARNGCASPTSNTLLFSGTLQVGNNTALGNEALNTATTGSDDDSALAIKITSPAPRATTRVAPTAAVPHPRGVAVRYV